MSLDPRELEAVLPNERHGGLRELSLRNPAAALPLSYIPTSSRDVPIGNRILRESILERERNGEPLQRTPIHRYGSPRVSQVSRVGPVMHTIMTLPSFSRQTAQGSSCSSAVQSGSSSVRPPIISSSLTSQQLQNLSLHNSAVRNDTTVSPTVNIMRTNAVIRPIRMHGELLPSTIASHRSTHRRLPSRHLTERNSPRRVRLNSRHRHRANATNRRPPQASSRTLSRNVLDMLPVFAYSRVSNGCQQDTCAVCHMNYSDGDELRRLPCLHAYHTHCIDHWLERHPNCPNCRMPVDSGIRDSYKLSGQEPPPGIDQSSSDESSPDRTTDGQRQIQTSPLFIRSLMFPDSYSSLTRQPGNRLSSSPSDIHSPSTMVNITRDGSFHDEHSANTSLLSRMSGGSSQFLTWIARRIPRPEVPSIFNHRPMETDRDPPASQVVASEELSHSGGNVIEAQAPGLSHHSQINNTVENVSDGSTTSTSALPSDSVTLRVRLSNDSSDELSHVLWMGGESSTSSNSDSRSIRDRGVENRNANGVAAIFSKFWSVSRKKKNDISSGIMSNHQSIRPHITAGMFSPRVGRHGSCDSNAAENVGSSSPIAEFCSGGLSVADISGHSIASSIRSLSDQVMSWHQSCSGAHHLPTHSPPPTGNSVLSPIAENRV